MGMPWFRSPGAMAMLAASPAAVQRVRYSYGFDGRLFVPAGQPVPLAKLSWWQRSRPAPFTFTRERDRAGPMSTGSMSTSGQ